jgi:hypothetical protein
MSEKMIIEIDETGTVQLTVKGVKGKACKNVSKQIEEALGRTTKSVPTNEMKEKPLTVNNVA